MARTEALISLTIFETKNEMCVYIRFVRACNISESAELSCVCPIFRREKFADPTRYAASRFWHLKCYGRKQWVHQRTQSFLGMQLYRGALLNWHTWTGLYVSQHPPIELQPCVSLKKSPSAKPKLIVTPPVLQMKRGAKHKRQFKCQWPKIYHLKLLDAFMKMELGCPSLVTKSPMSSCCHDMHVCQAQVILWCAILIKYTGITSRLRQMVWHIPSRPFSICH